MKSRDAGIRAFRYDSIAAFLVGATAGELGFLLFKDEIQAATLPHPEWVDMLIPVVAGLAAYLIYLHTWRGERLSGVSPRRAK